ncbi:thyroid hormone receptor interactor 10b [Trichomycterus rosablanca]|uniref:thyroid hormone receptor interactor 10b n=1 Tax=Trichomycterus rosablanca TaxID=2290929 RepID=UPI002F35948D
MDWGTALWDQHDAIEKHTQSGLDLVERYVKFVKERTEVEQNYTKQLRVLCKKYSRRGSREDQDMKFSNHQKFQDLVMELNNCATHREVMAESMNQGICMDLTKYLHDIKQERRNHLGDIRKAQQNLEVSFKQLENSKKRFEEKWKEAEKANQQAERIDQDPNSTKLDVDKAKQSAHQRVHTADEFKNEYAVQLQKYNKEQNSYYHTELPAILNKLQQMEERRIRKLAERYGLMADTEIHTLPSISKSLERFIASTINTDEKQDSLTLIEQHKSGCAPPADVEFEDYSQGIKPAAMDNTHHTPKVRIKLFKKKQPGATDRNMPAPVEDYSHLPLDQRKKRLQEKISEINKELQKEKDQSEALEKMKRVYEQNSQLGNPASLEPEINQTSHNISRLKGELSRYQTWLSEAEGANANIYQTSLEDFSVCDFPSPPVSDNLYEFDDDFDEDAPIAQCLALYNFNGNRDGEVSMEAGDHLNLIKEDSGDGWVRVKKTDGSAGYVPASYIKTI